MEDKCSGLSFPPGRLAGGGESGRFSPSDDTGRKDRLVGRLSGFLSSSLRTIGYTCFQIGGRTFGACFMGIVRQGDSLSVGIVFGGIME